MKIRLPWQRPAPPMPRLDCGCPDDGRPISGCIYCNHRTCQEHSNAGHECRCPTCLGSGTRWKEPAT